MNIIKSIKSKWKKQIETHGVTKTVLGGFFYLTVILYLGLFVALATGNRVDGDWGGNSGNYVWLTFPFVFMPWMYFWWWLIFPNSKQTEHPDKVRVTLKIVLATLLLLFVLRWQIDNWILGDDPRNYWDDVTIFFEALIFEWRK